MLKAIHCQVKMVKRVQYGPFFVKGIPRVCEPPVSVRAARVSAAAVDCVQASRGVPCRRGCGLSRRRVVCGCSVRGGHGGLCGP